MAMPTKEQLAQASTLELAFLLDHLVDEMKKSSRVGPWKLYEAFITALAA